MLDFVKKKLPTVSWVMYFRDGAVGQYKNCKSFSNLYPHKDDIGLLAEQHFFATSHGKRYCDGNGGTMKGIVAHASLQTTTSGHILTPSDMFE